MLLARRFAQVLEHGIEGGVESVACTFMALAFVFLAKVVVEHDEERFGVLHIPFAFGRELQRAVVLHILFQETGDDGLPDDRVPQFLVHVFTCTKQFQFVVLVGKDVVGVPSGHKVDDIIHPEILFHGGHGLQHDGESLFALNLGLGVHTVVTASAVVLVVFFAKVVQQHFASAHRRLCVCGSFLQQLSADVLLGHGFAFHKLLQFLQVFV